MKDLTSLLSNSRMRMVQLVKRRGTVTVDEVMDGLGLAETTVRQHFDRLLEVGVIESHSVVSGPGRPTLRYQLTPAGERLFPTQDAQLFGRVVEFLIQEGYPGLVDAFFRQVWQERRASLEQRLVQADAVTLAERLAVVEEFLADEGFLPEIEASGDEVIIRERNCPFCEGVEKTRLPCRLEAQLLEEVLQRDLERVGYMPDGHPACAYVLAAGAEDE